MNIKIIKQEILELESKPFVVDGNYLPNKILLIFKYNNRFHVSVYNEDLNIDNEKELINNSLSFPTQNDALECYNLYFDLLGSFDYSTIDHLNSRDGLDYKRF